MDFVILDLEWNSCYCKKFDGFINEIIEFGAVKVDEKMNIIGKFSTVVRPQIGKKLRSSVTTLTNITDEEVSRGCPFNYALSKFRKFANNCIIMTWSTSDILALIQNSRYHLLTDHLPFIKKYVDLQIYCQDMLGIPYTEKQLGLNTAAEILKIDTSDIPHHRALWDSIVSFMCFKELYSKSSLISHIRNADCENFYREILFRPTYLHNIENDLVEKEKMFFNCNKCAFRTTQISEWESKNKSFLADFICPNCGNKFTGKVQFKIKYDSVTMIKKVVDISKKDLQT